MAQFDIKLITGNTQTVITPTPVHITGTTTQKRPVYVTGYTSGGTISGSTQWIDVSFVTGNTIMSGITTTRVFSGLTSIDGFLLTAGILKFETVFMVGTTKARIIPMFFRSREIFELKYRHTTIIDYPQFFELEFTEEEFYQITPMILFTKVKDYMNDYLKVNAFEIIQY